MADVRYLLDLLAVSLARSVPRDVAKPFERRKWAIRTGPRHRQSQEQIRLKRTLMSIAFWQHQSVRVWYANVKDFRHRASSRLIQNDSITCTQSSLPYRLRSNQTIANAASSLGYLGNSPATCPAEDAAQADPETRLPVAISPRRRMEFEPPARRLLTGQQDVWKWNRLAGDGDDSQRRHCVAALRLNSKIREDFRPLGLASF